jgi:hypothetical protein
VACVEKDGVEGFFLPFLFLFLFLLILLLLLFLRNCVESSSWCEREREREREGGRERRRKEPGCQTKCTGREKEVKRDELNDERTYHRDMSR